MSLPKITASDLLPGDILLYADNPQKWHQRLISKKTGSPYTHAAIYIGNGEIAESTILWGVRKAPLAKSLSSLSSDGHIGVLRSQARFDGNRPWDLATFVSKALYRHRWYDWLGVLLIGPRSRKYYRNQLQYIQQNYGTAKATKFSMRGQYFCSAFVVHCYCSVGIIDKTAYIMYPIDILTPASLHRDDTFGWALGFLGNASSLPATDPLMKITHWHNVPSCRWWP